MDLRTPGRFTRAPAPEAPIGIPGVARFNRGLDGAAAQAYAPTVRLLETLVPDAVRGLDAPALLRQAYLFDTVMKFAVRFPAPRILCLDTPASAVFQALDELDYWIQCDRQLEAQPDPGGSGGSSRGFEIVFAATPLPKGRECHLIGAKAAKALRPGGIGILIAPGAAAAQEVLRQLDPCVPVDDAAAEDTDPARNPEFALVFRRPESPHDGFSVEKLLRERQYLLNRLRLGAAESSAQKNSQLKAELMAIENSPTYRYALRAKKMLGPLLPLLKRILR